MENTHFDLTGKVAVITGASRGIGESCAKLLAAYGAHVVVTSRKLADLERVADDIRDAGGQATAIACHAGDVDSMDALMQQVESEFGRLDVLMNNAATNPYFGNIVDCPLDAFDKIVQVNLRGYFYMCQLGVKLMKKNGGGSIINTASINGLKPGIYQGPYSMTKAGVINMTQAFAKECGADGIRINALLPGLTDTKFASALTSNEEILAKFVPQLPLGRPAQPDEMAGIVLFLASSASSYVTGGSFVIDGGATC